MKKIISLFLLLLVFLLSLCSVSFAENELSIEGSHSHFDENLKKLTFPRLFVGYKQIYELFPTHVMHVYNNTNQDILLEAPTSSTFHVGTLDKDLLSAGEYAVFSVMPKEGYAAGTVSETITIRGSYKHQPNTKFSTSFDVCVDILPCPYFAKSASDLTPIDTIDFGTFEIGSNPSETTRDFVLYNPTDEELDLYINSYEEYFADNFEYSSYTLAAKSYQLIQLSPRYSRFTSANTYTEEYSIGFSGYNTAATPTLTLPVKIKVVQPSGAYVTATQPDLCQIYEGDRPSRYVGLRNLGTQDTTVTISTSQYFDFAHTGSIPLKANQTGIFEFRPKANINLPKGPYTETLTISVSNGPDATLTIPFEIMGGNFRLQLESNTIDCGSAYEQYSSPSVYLKITNVGTARGTIWADSWMVDDMTIGIEDQELAPGESTLISVGGGGYRPGKYTSKFTILGSNNASASFTATFTRLEGDGKKTLFLSPADPQFGTVLTKNPVRVSEKMSFINQSDKTVTINIPELQYFKITGLNKKTLNPGERATFTLTPRNDLPVKEDPYDEMLYVYDEDGQLLDEVRTYFFLEPADYKVTYSHHPHCTFKTHDVDMYQGPYFPHGATFNFYVEFDQHYGPGEDFAVTCNGVPIEPNPYTGTYTIHSVEEDLKLKVDGVIYRIFHPKDNTDTTTNYLFARLDGNSNQILGELLTAEEEERIQNGEEYAVWLDVEDITKTISKANKKAIESVMDDGTTVAQYMNIELFKQIGKSEATIITNVGGEVTISVVVPEHLRESIANHERRFGIVRDHDGVVEKIYGEYDSLTGTLQFKTDRFSTYALCYEDVLLPELPATGDNSHMLYSAMLIILSTALLLSSRKKQRTV